jgi:hypothetical protein
LSISQLILPQKTGGQVKPLFISGGSISEVNNNYPKVEYSEAEILNDTKNILKQNFVEKYC